MSYTNPDPNLHIDLLKSQYAIFSKVLQRIAKADIITNDRHIDAFNLAKELLNLKILINKKQYESRR
jgi:hypothetical protein